MEIISIILVLIAALSFLSYGVSLFISDHMRKEFIRFDLEKYRKLIGYLEILGGLGLFTGIIYHPVLIISSGGLSILMLLGIWVRLKVKDSLILILPALLFLVLNSYIFVISIIIQ